MFFYLTYNDVPSGIFSSQVIDVVKFFNNDLEKKTKLISFISIRGFLQNRKKIKTEFSSAIVLPMFPGIKNWKWNWVFLFVLVLIYKPKSVIGRSVLATQLGLKIKSLNKKLKVVYDGRGAISAEWNEYKVVTDPKLLNTINQLEEECIINSDFRIAVSQALVNYWKETFNYNSTHHVIIPCTLNQLYLKNSPLKRGDLGVCKNVESQESTLFLQSPKSELNIQENDIVFVYSGSVAGWQSFHLLYDFLKPILTQYNNCKVLFLSEFDQQIENLKKEFPNQIIQKHVTINQVPNYLSICNYGLLIREQSMTNKVASPVKFAEYLACGLPVIISENLGDYSTFVQENACGCLVSQFNFQDFKKKYCREIALNHFTKKEFVQQYNALSNVISS